MLLSSLKNRLLNPRSLGLFAAVTAALIAGENSLWAMGPSPSRIARSRVVFSGEAELRPESKDAIQQIRLLLPAISPQNVKVLVDEQLAQPLVRVRLAAASDAELQSLKAGLKLRRLEDNSVAAENTASSYQCDILMWNGGIREIGGACVREAEVILPSAFDVHVYAQETLIYGSMEFSDLKVILKNPLSFMEGKIAALTRYLSQSHLPERALTAAQAAEVLAIFPFDREKERAARLLSGRLIDPENAQIVGRQFMFEAEKHRSIELLSRANADGTSTASLKRS